MENSKFHKALKIIAIISYCLILLRGEMILLPFFFFIYISIFNFGELRQITSLFVIGSLSLIIYLKRNKNYNWSSETIIFSLLLIPIFERLLSIELIHFYYYGFLVPLFIFIVSYLLLITLKIRESVKLETDKEQKLD